MKTGWSVAKTGWPCRRGGFEDVEGVAAIEGVECVAKHLAFDARIERKVLHVKSGHRRPRKALQRLPALKETTALKEKEVSKATEKLPFERYVKRYRRSFLRC